MKRISVLVLMIGTLILALSLSLGILSPPFLTGFLTSRAQTSWDSKFWVFNGQMVDFVKLINRGIEEGRSEATLLGQGEAQVGTLAVAGAGLGGALALAAAARNSRINAVAADTPMALGHPAVLEASSAYPLAEFNNYLRVFPHRREVVLASLAPLNPSKVASRVEAPVLLSLGRRDRGLCPLDIGEEVAAQLPRCDLRVYDGGSEGGGHSHGQTRSAWLKHQLGLD